MGRMKELFMAEQERMAEAYAEAHPDATEEEIYEWVNRDQQCDDAMLAAAEKEEERRRDKVSAPYY